ncbi:MAG TPA: Hsp33 family molecular chaperone HslO [Bacillota bacterium]|nr:Hsp33 family molecular chaperone HslO [Bacillota bacterium]
MKDNLVIATAFADTVRIYAAVTTQVIETARETHGTWPTATAAMGRLLTAALIMGVMSDNPYRLTVRISGNGPAGEVVAVSNHRGRVKGYMTNPQIDLDLNAQGKLNVSGALGRGTLTVTKDLGLKDPYHGIIPLQTGEIAEDLAFYFTKSEQTPSAVALGVLVAPEGQVKAGGGLIIQLMPNAAESTIDWLEQKLNTLPALTSLLESGLSSIELIRELFGAETGLKILEELDTVVYQCDCSRDKFRGPLLSLGAAELDHLLAEQGEIEVRCHFCNQIYHYQPEDLETVQGRDAGV